MERSREDPKWPEGGQQAGESPAERAMRGELEYHHGGPWRCRCNKCKELVTAYAEFIRRFEPFEWFINAMTFEDVIHPEQADRRYRRFLDAVNESLFGRRWRKRGQGVYSIRATEYQRRKVLHYHALAGGGVYKLRRKEWEQRWQAQDEGNGFLRIYPYDPTMGGTLYIAKYVSKGGEVDLFLPRWLNKKLQRELSQEGLAGVVEDPVLTAYLRRRAAA